MFGRKAQHPASGDVLGSRIPSTLRRPQCSRMAWRQINSRALRSSRMVSLCCNHWFNRLQPNMSVLGKNMQKNSLLTHLQLQTLRLCPSNKHQKHHQPTFFRATPPKSCTIWVHVASKTSDLQVCPQVMEFFLFFLFLFVCLFCLNFCFSVFVWMILRFCSLCGVLGLKHGLVFGRGAKNPRIFRGF